MGYHTFECHKDRPGLARPDPRVVVWRSQKARNHQLPHAQAGDATACSASASLAPRRTGSATAANIRESATRARSATNAASRSRAPRCAASAWAISSWPRRFRTSGTSRASRRRMGLLLDISPARAGKGAVLCASYIVHRSGRYPADEKADAHREGVPRHAARSMRTISAPAWARRRSRSCCRSWISTSSPRS